MLTGLRHFLRALRASTSGAVAIEFIFVAPLLAALLVGFNELARWARAGQHLEDYVTSIATDLSGASDDIPAATLREMIERIGLLAPELIDPSRNAWAPTTTNSSYLGVGISVAMISLTNNTCHTNCSYQGKLLWTFGSSQRACGSVTLPTGIEMAGPVVIVDAKSQYKFVFGVGNSLGSAPLLSTTTFRPLRNWQLGAEAPAVNPSSSGAWAAVTCPQGTT